MSCVKPIVGNCCDILTTTFSFRLRLSKLNQEMKETEGMYGIQGQSMLLFIVAR